MVYFVCESCQETLKKSQVDMHAARCRNCWAVSCVDCSKVFEGNSYAQHTSCISEAEKYEKSVYKGPKPSNKKKRNPQEEWMDIIMEAAGEARGPSAGGLSNIVKTYLPRMADMGNVPRNEKKFKNFTQNSLRVYREQDQAELWSFLEKRRAALAAAAAAEQEAVAAAKIEEEGAPTQQISENEEKAEKEEKGRKRGVKPQDDEEEVSKKKKIKKDVNGHLAEVVDDFNWGPVIKKLVKKAENRQMELKELRKAVAASAAERGHILPQDKKAVKKILLVKIEEVQGLSLQDGVVSYSKA